MIQKQGTKSVTNAWGVMMGSNNRVEIREIDQNNSSVEFLPGNAQIAYHFKLRDYSSKGLGILVKEDSKVLGFLNVGDELDMKFYQGSDGPKPVPIKTRIVHISHPEKGQHLNHLIVGLTILG